MTKGLKAFSTGDKAQQTHKDEGYGQGCVQYSGGCQAQDSSIHRAFEHDSVKWATSIS